MSGRRPGAWNGRPLSVQLYSPAVSPWPALLLVLAALPACESRGTGSSAPSVSKPSPRQLGQRVAAALAAGDAAPVVGLLPATGADVRVEIRQSLVETDERNSETLRSGADVESWLAKTRPKWSCSGESCAWPGGLKTGELERCIGDCCFSDWPGGIEKKTLYLRRVCVAAREAGEPRLSYIGFVEAK